MPALLQGSKPSLIAQMNFQTEKSEGQIHKKPLPFNQTNKFIMNEASM